ncbi:MAG: hypothetical protein LBS11_03465 [Oscillospiraceae bacterium]|jgi:hypothetical protein|nr:hypothetical protein [Oscillospiraceae bacterium]
MLTGHNTKWIKLSAIAGLAGAICWAIGDILIVGFRINITDYPLIADSAAFINKELAALMVPGETWRLAAGALFGAFSLPLKLFALYCVTFLLLPAGRRYALTCAAILFAGFAWSPMAHAGFFYLGETVKTALGADAVDAARVLALAGTFERILMILYIPAVAAENAGWLLVSIAALRGRTMLPRYFGAITPLPMTMFWALVVPLLPASISTPLQGAQMNLAGIVFYTAVCVFCYRTRKFSVA